MSNHNEGARCWVCGLYEARVFDPSGAMWCHVCDLMGLGDYAVREHLAAASLATEAGDPDMWGEPFVPDYGAINERWREQMSNPGRLYLIPEPVSPRVDVFVPGIVESLDQADRGYIWEDTQGARWGWTKQDGWLAWQGGVAPYNRGAVGPFVFVGPNTCDENGKPARDIPEWIKRMQADGSNTAGEPSTSANAEVSNGDAVEHPSHYTSSPATCSACGEPIECIDVTQHMGFNLGNTTKYVWRCDLKRDAIEDLRKARQYLDFEIAKREREAAASA